MRPPTIVGNTIPRDPGHSSPVHVNVQGPRAKTARARSEGTVGGSRGANYPTARSPRDSTALTHGAKGSRYRQNLPGINRLGMKKETGLIPPAYSRKK